MTLISMINLWLLGNRKENIPPLSKFSSNLVSHFDTGGKKLSKMRQIMSHVEVLGTAKGVWVNSGWDGAKVTELWSTIWEDMDPFLRTETQIAKGTLCSLLSSF